jgi:hypothetical protein
MAAVRDLNLERILIRDPREGKLPEPRKKLS